MDQTKGNIWEQFSGKNNTETVLAEKAERLARHMMLVIPNDLKLLVQEIEKVIPIKINDPKQGEALIEMHVLYLNLINRAALKPLADKTDFFMRAISVGVRDLLAETFSKNINEVEAFRIAFGTLYNKRQSEYMGMKLIAEGDEARANTVFWEFSKMISQIMVSRHDLMAIMATQIMIPISLGKLKLKELFTE